MPERRTGHDLLARIRENPQLATAQQLSAVFDIDLWKAARPGEQERFDDSRFREWVEVLFDADPVLASERLAQIDPALVIGGLSPCIAVFDAAAFSPAAHAGIHAEIGGYVVAARQAGDWTAMIDALHALAEHQPIAFHRIMRGCRALSNSGRELDGCDDLMTDAEQARFDLSVRREERRERLGFLPPPQAHAFLEGARRLSFREGPPAVDPVFAAYRWSQRVADESEPPPMLVEELRPDGVPAVSRGLLPAPPADQPELTPAFNAYLLRLAGRDDIATLSIAQELAFLTNAAIAGCSVQHRPLTATQALEVVAATCNLGLECWPNAWGDPAAHDLVSIFRVGWAVLHRDVCIAASRELLTAAETITCSDRDLQMGLYALRREVQKWLQQGTPWRARDALDVLASLDLPTWAAMLALLGDCPVMLANVRPQAGRRAYTVNPSEFRFVATRDDVAAVHEFLRTLAERLTE
jgi:uncharacterized protein DUF6178